MLNLSEHSCLTVSTEIGTPSKSMKSRNSNSSVQIQIQPKSRFEFVPRDTEESEFPDLVDFGGGAFPVETGIGNVYTTVAYGVAMIGRLLKIIGLFCERDLQKRPIF